MRNLLVILVIIIGFSTCKKEAGEGGTSTIQGKVYQLRLSQNNTTGVWDTLSYKLDSEKEVYIIYSDDEDDIYDDSFDTHWNGEYRFEFLRKGDYTIYTYSDWDSLGIADVHGDYPVFKHIKIDANNKTFVVDDFVILKNPSD